MEAPCKERESEIAVPCKERESKIAIPCKETESQRKVPYKLRSSDTEYRQTDYMEHERVDYSVN